MVNSNKGQHDRQLAFTTLVTTPSGEEMVVKILVDTGAQVNLVRRGLFQDEGIPAKDPVRLQAAGGQILGGGTRTLKLALHLVATDYGTNEDYTHVVNDNFYIADITCDVILSYPLLRSRKIGVMPHKRRLLWEHHLGWTWLREGF